MLFYGFDTYYFILVLPAIIFAFFAQAKVQRTYAKYSKRISTRNITGAEAARTILDINGLSDISIEKIEGNLTDNYDPRKKVIHLSSGVYDSASVAAIGIAAHETGHAVQHSKRYFPLQIRNAIIPVTQIGSTLAFPLILIGVIMNFRPLIYAAIVFFALAALFQLITLPVEYNASNRAVETLDKMNILNDEELHSTKKVLNAAAWTYVAALAVSLASLLRLLLLFGGGRRSD